MVVILLFIAHTIKSQVPTVSEESLNADMEYSINIWNSENGLPQNNIIKLIQSSDGYIWLLTSNGVIRFDGISFKTYNVTNTPGFPESTVMDIMEDSQKNIWIIYNKGLTKITGEKIIANYFLKETNGLIICACNGLNDNFMIGTSTGKIFSFKNEQFSFMMNTTGFIIKNMEYMGRDFYVGSNKGLYKLQNNHFVFVEVVNKDEIRNIVKNEDGSIFVSNQFHIYKIKKDSIIDLKIPKKILSQQDEKYLAAFLVDNSRIWLATKQGVAVVEGDHYTLLNVDNGLSANEISWFLKDREGNVWLNTIYGGINKLRHKTIKSYAETENYLGGSSGSIIKGYDQSILVANYCNGIYETNHRQFKNCRIGVGCTWTLLMDHTGILWSGGYGTGLVRIQNKQTTVFKGPNNLPSDYVYALFEDKSHTIWIGTSEGIATYKNGKFDCLKNTSGLHINQIVQDKNGQMWFCSKQGLGQVKDNTIKLLTTKDGLPNNNVRCLYEDDDGAFWIVTYGGGLARLKNGVVFAYDKIKDLINNYASCLLEDQHGSFWISTNNGIYSLSKNDLNNYADGKSSFLISEYHGRDRGMKYTECNGGFQSPGMINEDGLLIFPTVNGIAIVNGNNNIKTDYTPTLLIEKAIIDNNQLSLDDSVSTFTEKANKLEIHYNAPYFSNLKNLRFQYILEGLEDDWNNPTTSRVAIYEHLPPGKYTFKVRIYGSTNQRFNKEKTISFIIKAPFWKTWTFFYSALCFFTLLFMTIVYIRIKIIRKREAEKTEINKNYALLELKALQGQMNPHFIFNCLNTIKFFITTDDKISANKYLGKFANLVRMFLVNSNNNYITLQTEIDLLKLYVELEQLRVDHRFDVSLSIDPALNTHDIKMPGMLFQPFIENAIHHGLRLSDKKRVLNITFKKDGDKLIGSIEDNGIGRVESIKRKSEQVKTHVSIGIKTIEERIATINYIENISIKLEIIDKLNTENESEGTFVIITIPLNKINTL